MGSDGWHRLSGAKEISNSAPAWSTGRRRTWRVAEAESEGIRESAWGEVYVWNSSPAALGL